MKNLFIKIKCSARALLIGLGVAILLIAIGQTGWAQDEQNAPPPEPAEAVQSQEVVLPKAPLGNAAYEEALAAREAIDTVIKTAFESGDSETFDKAVEERKHINKSIADAAMKKYNQLSASGVESVAATPKKSKKSLIPTNPEDIKVAVQKILDKIISWLTSPAFLAMVGVVIFSYFASPIVAKMFKKRIPLLREAPKEGVKFRIVRHYLYQASNLLRPIFLVGLLALGALILKNIPILGQDWLVKLAQGLAVVFLLFKGIKQFVKNSLFQKIAIWVAVPLALLMVFGYYDDLLKFLNGTILMKMGDTPITLMTFVRLAIFGGLFFWLGGISNSKGQTAIRSQETLDIATREVVAKMFQILLFIIIFVLILSMAGIPLSGLVMVFSAVGLGIGFGLQPIAANFISGLIILFDRSVKVGDYVLLPDGQEGHVEAINMRSTIVETTDGKDIMVPNVKFIDEAYENWTHTDPRQRYEVYFSVAYDTDINTLEDILIPAVSAYPKVLQEPEKPDLELREFGDFGIKFAIEFWVDGIDDGENKFTSDLNFIVWRTLKKHGIVMPLPQREIKMLK